MNGNVLVQNAEMNLTELEEALQQLNQHLISEKEMQYIYHVRSITSSAVHLPRT